jgi:endonuclease I
MKSEQMKKCFIISVLLFFSFQSFTQIPSGYYDGTAGLTGDALKTALNDIIDGHTELSYEAVKEALKQTDEDTLNANNVICLYSGWSYAKTEFGNGSEQWNREHVWSKSHGDFGNVAPAGTDLHHLRPADASVNSAKNNRDFDNGATQYIDGSGTTDCYYSTYLWEPRDEVKGDVARMIFYMATRYEGENSEPDLELVNYVNTAPLNDSLYGKLCTLLDWHDNDPVDDWERNRNDVIYYTYQGNRNPFIDHPEFVDDIWGGTDCSLYTSLIISEVADPANVSLAKYVELFNSGSSSIDFSTETWYLSRQANGGNWANTQLVGSVGAGETYIISYNSTAFLNSYGFAADKNSSVISGNGDDGYFLYYGGNNASGTLIDAYGVKDVDGSGEDWEYTDTKAVRIFNVTAPDSSWKANEWFISSTADDTDMTPDSHHKLLEWNGSSSTDWYLPANWSDGAANALYYPDAGCSVTVSNTSNNVIVSGEASCGYLQVDELDILILQTGSSLTVGGN